MQEFQQRVIDEKAELDGKIEKLGVFLSSEVFDKLPRTHKELLVIQWFTMTQYSDILSKRIALF